MGAIKQAATGDMEAIVRALTLFGAKDATFSENGFVIFFPNVRRQCIDMLKRWCPVDRVITEGMPLELGDMKVASWEFVPGAGLIAARQAEGPSSEEVLEEYGVVELDLDPWRWSGLMFLEDVKPWGD